MKKALILSTLFILAFILPLNLDLPLIGIIYISIISSILGILFIPLIRKGSLIYQSYQTRSDQFTFNFVQYLAISAIIYGFGILISTFVFNGTFNLLSPILITFGTSVLLGIKVDLYFSPFLKN